MHSSLFASLSCIASVAASPILKRTQPDNTQPVGTNPINGFSVDFLGVQTPDNSCSHRDLGFIGQIAGQWYAIYGDDLYCAPGVTDPSKDTSGLHGMVRDSVAAVTNSALKTHYLQLNNDSLVAHTKQFVPFNESWGETRSTGFGGTSLCETDADAKEGLIFYLVNEAGLKGAGVGQVNVLNGVPTVTKRLGDNGYWWDSATNARYGDVAAFRDPNSEYIYAWGGAPTSITDYVGSQYVYVARVNASEAFELSKYEYWWGREQGWKSDVLTTFNCDTSPLWGSGQGQLMYSAFHKTYYFVHMSDYQVAIKTAPSPEGPWTQSKILYKPTIKSDGMAYAAAAHLYLDESGKTLTVSYTNHPNAIEVIKITFDS